MATNKIEIKFPWADALEEKSEAFVIKHPGHPDQSVHGHRGGMSDAGSGNKFEGMSSTKLIMSRNKENAKEVDAELDRRNAEAAIKARGRGKTKKPTIGKMEDYKYEQHQMRSLKNHKPNDDVKEGSGFSPTGLKDLVDARGKKPGKMTIIGNKARLTVTDKSGDNPKVIEFERKKDETTESVITTEGGKEKKTQINAWAHDAFNRLTGGAMPKANKPAIDTSNDEEDNPKSYGLGKGSEYH